MFDEPPKNAKTANHLLGFFQEEKKQAAPNKRAGPPQKASGYSRMAKR